MSRKQIILLIILVAVAGGSWYAYSEYNRKNKDLSGLKAFEKLSSVELVQKFQSNEKDANSKYLDKVLAVTGNIKEITNSNGNYTIALGDVFTMNSVRCSMDSTHQQEAANLIKGAKVVIKGICTGFNADELLGSDVILNRCIIETK